MTGMTVEAKFRESVAWQRAMGLAEACYEATRVFPKEEMFGLTSQIRRASVSVASNIAEGQGRATLGEFIHFLGMARGSALEVQTQLELALRLNLGSNEKIKHAQQLAVEVARILNASMTTMRAQLAAASKRKRP